MAVIKKKTMNTIIVKNEMDLNDDSYFIPFEIYEFDQRFKKSEKKSKWPIYMKI